MKGVVLAGGLGTRMQPLTRVTNKHLLPVFDRPMVYYPIQCLVNAGITDIQIVTGGNSAGHFLQLLGNGSDFGLKDLSYTYQRGEGGRVQVAVRARLRVRRTCRRISRHYSAAESRGGRSMRFFSAMGA